MAGIELGLNQRGSLAMTPSLRQAIGFLALSNAVLAARLAELHAANTALVAERRNKGVLSLGLMRQVPPPLGGRAHPAVFRPRGLGGMDAGMVADAAPGLVAHVQMQVPLLVRNVEDQPIARALLCGLEPSGWLGVSLEEIASETGCSVARAETVLLQLQGAEPTGLFSRSLAECLSLQIREEGLMTPAFSALLDNLPLVAEGNPSALAEVCACTTRDVAEMIRALRRLNPKPGAGFDLAEGSRSVADLALRRDGDGWLLELNVDDMPTLRIDKDKAETPELLREARAMVQALERRHVTVLTIAAEIVARQDAHLRGLAPLAALTMDDVASATGFHRSTVSRVTAALSMATPRRTSGLRALMSRSAPAARRLDEPMSVDAVLQRMKEIVASENPARPHSDEALSRLLLAEGAALARRTVAKYRRLAGIPAQAERRRAA